MRFLSFGTVYRCKYIESKELHVWKAGCCKRLLVLDKYTAKFEALADKVMLLDIV